MNPQPNNQPKPPIPENIYPNAHNPRPNSQPVPDTTPPLLQPPKHHHSQRDWRSTLSTISLFLLAPLVALCIAAFMVQSYQVDGESMETTLQNNDRLIVDKLPRTLARITHHAYIPARGNIIIFNQSGLPDSGPSGQKQLIKRVIGLPGERLVIKDGHITIYNRAHPEGFNPDTTTGYHIAATTTSGNVDITLGANQIFVNGDNRPNSEDSRFFGPVNADQIVGRLVLRLLPINEIEKF